MKRIQETKKYEHNGVLPFITIVGLASFYLAGMFDGGLNSAEGFVAGVALAIVILFILALLDVLDKRHC